MNGLLSLKWNSHSATLLKKLKTIYSQDVFCDVTIACHGKFYPVHKLILSICSEYFEEIFKQTDCKHPFIIMKDIKPIELEALLSYMYKGEVNVSQDMLPGLISAAEALKIIGLAVTEENLMDEDKPKSKKRKPESLNNSVSNENYLANHPSKEALPSSLMPSQEEMSKRRRRESLETVEEEKYLADNIKTELEDLREIEDMNQLNGTCFRENSNLYESQSSTIENDNVSSVKSPSFMPIKDEEYCESDFPLAQCSSWDNAINSMTNLNTVQEEICETIVETANPDDPEFNSSLMESTSPKTKEEYECSYCPFGSFSKNVWRQHCFDQHPGNQLYGCKMCKYQTSLKYLLNRHMYVHNGEKKFKCHLCSYKTAYSFNMKTHYHKHTINFH